MPDKKKPLLGVLLFAGVFLYLGWEVVRQETGALRGGDVSQTWPTTVGRVIASSVQTKHGTGGGTNRYDPIVEYEYTVDGTVLRGDRISFDTQAMDHTSATGITKRYPVGHEVTVYYDSEDPENSVLEPGTPGMSWLGIGVGIVFAVVAGAMLITRLRQRGS